MPGPDDELKDLGDTIDGLLDRLETAFSPAELTVLAGKLRPLSRSRCLMI